MECMFVTWDWWHAFNWMTNKNNEHEHRTKKWINLKIIENILGMKFGGNFFTSNSNSQMYIAVLVTDSRLKWWKKWLDANVKIFSEIFVLKEKKKPFNKIVRVEKSINIIKWECFIRSEPLIQQFSNSRRNFARFGRRFEWEMFRSMEVLIKILIAFEQQTLLRINFTQKTVFLSWIEIIIKTKTTSG